MSASPDYDVDHLTRPALPKLDTEQESERLTALASYGILDSDREPIFDDIAELARQVCRAPISLVTFVDVDRQWFKAHPGIEAGELPRSSSICQYTMLGSEVFVVEDTHADPRHASNPLVTGPPYMRFYAGAPLASSHGIPLGALCVIDTEPRVLLPARRAALERLARLVMTQLEMRKLLTTVSERERRMRQIANSLGMAVNEQTQEIEEINASLNRESEDRRLVEEALRQAQKMEAVGQLTGGIAHDFNNLLTGITGSLQLMQRALDAGLHESLPRFVDQAMESARRAASLTHRLLAFSRKQTLMPRTVDLNALIASLEDLLRRTLGSSIELVIDLNAQLPLATVDPNQLDNALINLVINARDAMPDGGRVTLRTATHNADAKGMVSIRVIDTGVGMPPHVVDRAFDPFFTTKPIGQGTGLGLSMVYGFVRQSGGEVLIESAEGTGTTIELLFPLAPAEVRMTDGVEPPPRAPEAAAAASLLLVEDQETVREVMRELLTDLGYRVTDAEEATAAMQVIESTATIDLLITDVGLPGINGRQLAEAARQKRPGLKVLFATGYADKLVAESAEPGISILVKPFDLDTLATRVKELLDA